MKRAIIRYSTTLIVILNTLLTMSAQESQLLSKYVAHYEKGMEFYSKMLYQAADAEFDLALAYLQSNSQIQRAEVEGYKVLIAIKLDRPNKEALVKDYVSNYPFSNQLSSIYLSFATHFFEYENYNRSLELLNKVDTRSLNNLQRAEYNFKLGYSNMRVGNLTNALSIFDSMNSGKYTTYTNPALYYSAYIHYMLKDFKKAKEGFAKIKGDPQFDILARYYMLESDFMLKDYDAVIISGEQIYDNLAEEFKEKCARILSEAFYNKGETEKAKIYFDKYSGSNSKLSRNDHYYEGMISYKLNNYPAAIESFSKVISIADTLSQNAKYHMGYCYAEIKNKQMALQLFKEASEMNFDKLIKEDAMFNYAKLSFDLNSDITKFQSYLAEYSPPDTKFNEIQNYIAGHYLLSGEYKAAVDALKLIRHPSDRDKANLQKASFLRGMQLMEKGGYREAIQNFELSRSCYTGNIYLKNLASFWLAEAYFRNGQIQKSIEINLALLNKELSFKKTPEYPVAVFNLAYGYFKLPDYQKAEENFKKYLASSSSVPDYISEAKLRTGDCLFMQKNYSGAIEFYSQIDSRDQLSTTYARYQMAISYGLLGNDNKKKDILKEVVDSKNKNRYFPEILYELGRTLVQRGEGEEAVKYFKELSEEYKDTPYFTKALLELGLISLNSKDYSGAIQYYKTILEKAPDSQDAQSAIAGLENIYQEQGEAEEFLSYLDQKGLSTTKSASDKELMLFNSAEKLYLSGNLTGAISALNSFISKYPSSVKLSQAYYYLGELYLKSDKPEQALDAFLTVMQKGEGSFVELATLNYARIAYRLEDYKRALEGYSTLSIIAKLPNNQIEAEVGRINSFFMNKQYENAIAEAQKINTNNLEQSDRLRIKYVMAKSYYLLGERNKALPLLREIAKNKVSPEGAECQYLIIANAFDSGDFQTVEKEVFAFSDSNTPQTYWLAKSFILLGDSYAEKQEWEQAEATFKSILESYKPSSKDDIEDQVMMRLSKISKKKNK